MTFDKVELTFDMCIARPHPKTPLRFFDVCFRRLESQNVYKEDLAPCCGIFRNILPLLDPNKQSSIRGSLLSSHPPCTIMESSLVFLVFVVFPVFWTVFGPQDSETELCKLM